MNCPRCGVNQRGNHHQHLDHSTLTSHGWCTRCKYGRDETRLDGPYQVIEEPCVRCGSTMKKRPRHINAGPEVCAGCDSPAAIEAIGSFQPISLHDAERILDELCGPWQARENRTPVADALINDLFKGENQ